jgi:hypothetical protein
MGRKVEMTGTSHGFFGSAGDILLFQGDYTICFYIFLVLYCAACCRSQRK